LKPTSKFNANGIVIFEYALQSRHNPAKALSSGMRIGRAGVPNGTPEEPGRCRRLAQRALLLVAHARNWRRPGCVGIWIRCRPSCTLGCTARTPNARGFVGGDANAPGPGKRPLSSMSPTIMFRDGRVFMVTGTPGGSRIITTVLQVLLNVIDHGMNIAEAVAAPRVHRQWLPDRVQAEQGLSPDTVRRLEAKGHKVTIAAALGSANSILVTPEGLTGAAGPRQRGTPAEGY
jgi:hypothetical protein